MLHPLSPTTVLPALATLPACNATCVGEALRALRDVYFPHVPPLVVKGAVLLSQSLSEAVTAVRSRRVACLVHHDGVPDSGYASAEEDDQDDQDDRAEAVKDEEEIEDRDEALGILRLDELERGYAIKWLTGFVKRGDTWVCASAKEQDARTKHLEDASQLLARFAGDDAPEEAVARTFNFPFRIPSCASCDAGNSLSPAAPIAVELNDAPVDGTDHTAVGLQSWGSAIIFADWMCLDPERYLGTLHYCSTDETKTNVRQRRVLELGAGTGLLSITASQIFSRTSLRASIKATDYHPSVLENLAQNVRQNRSTARVFVEKLDWCALPSTDVGTIGDKEVGGYDVVLAADVVYYPEHARWLRGCVRRMLKKGGVFWLIIPVRTVGRHQGLCETVEEVFPVVGEEKGDDKHLAIVSREEIEKVDGVGRADEGGYTLFEIRWVSCDSIT
ncbi:S-adenosyl-L-methionine-dependent methyltransferase [Chiua virens]|nr:S-adenosyl-L-methionine-dependent methyltransferase [Chiua virens]